MCEISMGLADAYHQHVKAYLNITYEHDVLSDSAELG